MDFLKNNRRFDFLYGETPFSKLECQVMQTEGENELLRHYGTKTFIKNLFLSKEVKQQRSENSLRCCYV